jgi:NADH-quinone oxidoreductase subunit E
MSLASILEKYPQAETHLLAILQEYQDQKDNHSISESEVKEIADYLGITESKVASVISFYTLLSLKPRGKHIIQVCQNVPCFVNDSPLILKTIEQILGIHLGETTPNNLFTLEGTSCLGCCDQAPVIRIDGKIYGNLTPDKVKAIISEYRGRQS